MSKYEACYIGDGAKPYAFTIDMEAPNPECKNSFAVLADEFRSYIGALGKNIDFPMELISQLDEDDIDVLMIDAQVRPESTFFIVTSTPGVIFFNRHIGGRYRLVGNNGIKSIFKSVDDEKIIIIKSGEALKSFGKIE